MSTIETKLIPSNISSKEGLLWRNGKFIPLPEADIVARKHGFVYAEQLVRYLKKDKK
jgi:hypothetical protein